MICIFEVFNTLKLEDAKVVHHQCASCPINTSCPFSFFSSNLKETIEIYNASYLLAFNGYIALVTYFCIIPQLQCFCFMLVWMYVFRSSEQDFMVYPPLPSDWMSGCATEETRKRRLGPRFCVQAEQVSTMDQSPVSNSFTDFSCLASSNVCSKREYIWTHQTVFSSSSYAECDNRYMLPNSGWASFLLQFSNWNGQVLRLRNEWNTFELFSRKRSQ